MPRKASTTVITPPQEINLDAYRGEKDALETMAKAARDIGNEQLQAAQFVGERLGRRSMVRLITNLLSVADLTDIKNFKESKQYKGHVIISPDGDRKTITTWEEYCQHVEGKTARAIDMELQNLDQLGAELFESMRGVGFGPSKMREIRQLPEELRAELVEIAKGGDKDALVELAEELIAKHARERDELNRKLLDAQRDHIALSKVEADTSQKLRETKLELEKVQLRTAPWSEKVSAFQIEITQRQALIDEAMGRHLQAVEALDAWILGEAVSRPDYNPEAPLEMPMEVRTVLVELHDAINRSAHQAAAARAALYERFGPELAQARQYLLQVGGDSI